MSSPPEYDVARTIYRILHSDSGGSDLDGVMAKLVAATSTLPLTSLDLWERSIRAALWDREGSYRPGGGVTWKDSGSPPRWLDLCSGDGFKRERMLRSATDGAPNGLFFTLAVRRLNDWVPQVRVAARECLPSIARRTDPAYIVDALWATLPHFTSWGHLDTAGKETLVDLIAIDQVSHTFIARMIQATTGPAALILNQAGRTPVLDPWLDKIAATAVQPSVRAKAYRCLLEGRIVWVAGRQWTWIDIRWCKGRFEPILEHRLITTPAAFLPLLTRAMADRSAVVRRVAAESLSQRLEVVGPQARLLAERLLSDRSPSVADYGRFVLSQLDKIPPGGT